MDTFTFPVCPVPYSNPLPPARSYGKSVIEWTSILAAAKPRQRYLYTKVSRNHARFHAFRVHCSGRVSARTQIDARVSTSDRGTRTNVQKPFDPLSAGRFDSGVFSLILKWWISAGGGRENPRIAPLHCRAIFIVPCFFFLFSFFFCFAITPICLLQLLDAVYVYFDPSFDKNNYVQLPSIAEMFRFPWISWEFTIDEIGESRVIRAVGGGASWRSQVVRHVPNVDAANVRFESGFRPRVMRMLIGSGYRRVPTA